MGEGKVSDACTSVVGFSSCSYISFFLKNKNQLNATYYFIVLLMGSTSFGHYYAHHQEQAAGYSTTLL
jgi:hypothetical protein